MKPTDKVDPLRDKSFLFATRIVKLARLLQECREFVLSKQVLRSGTSIGASIREGQYAQSKADFVNKLSIALKEANETEYWLLLLQETGTVDAKVSDNLRGDCAELIRMLISSILTAKG